MDWALPPSPTFSVTDSLAGIDDLDAFLAAQGDLSRFPTPPPLGSELLKKDDIIVSTTEILEDDLDDLSIAPVAPLDDEYVADIFSAVAGTDQSSTFYETVLIQDMLKRALLPPEILALSLNILIHYNDRRLALAHAVSLAIPADLLTAAAFVLAVDYLEDNAPNAHYWSRHVTWDVWSPRRIDETRLHILHTLDWRLHPLATPQAVMEGRSKLHRAPVVKAVALQAKLSHNKVQPPLRLEIGDAIACWVNGQLTPEASPSPLEPEAEHLFLPLLCPEDDKEPPALRVEINDAISWWMDGHLTPENSSLWSLRRAVEPLFLPLL